MRIIEDNSMGFFVETMFLMSNFNELAMNI